MRRRARSATVGVRVGPAQRALERLATAASASLARLARARAPDRPRSRSAARCSADRVALEPLARARPRAGRSPGPCASGPCGGRSAPRSASAPRRRARARPPRPTAAWTAQTSLPSILAWHRVAVGAVGEPLDRRRRRERRVLAVEVVLADEDRPAASRSRRGSSPRGRRRCSSLPSPKKQSVTSSLPRVAGRRSRARSRSAGGAPTIANEPSAPTLMSVRCIEPPLPPHRPSALPRISPNARSSGAPMASTAPWPRYVQVIVSPSRSARQRRPRPPPGPGTDAWSRAPGLGEEALALLLEEADLEHRAEEVELRLERDSGELVLALVLLKRESSRGIGWSPAAAAAARSTAARSCSRPVSKQSAGAETV